MEIAKVVTKGYEWFKAEGKTLLKENGIEWKTEDFFIKVYGWQKSYAYKLLKASALETQVVDNFKTECDRIDAEGKEAERSVAALLKYAKDGTIGGDEDGEEGGEGKPSVVATFTFKGEGGNVSVRIMSDGSVKTSNDRADVMQSLSNFREMLMGAPNTEETLENVMDAIAGCSEAELEARGWRTCDERAYGEEY